MPSYDGLAAAVVGWVAAAALLLPPVDAVADSDLTVHMFQHIGIFAFALVFGYGLEKVIMKKSASIRRITEKGWKAFTAVMRFNAKTRGVIFVVALPTLVFGYWHYPQYFDLAVQNESVHIFEHSTLFLAGSFVGLSFQAVKAKWRVLLLYLAFMNTGMMGSIWSVWRPPFYSLYSYAANLEMDTTLLVFGATGVVLTSAWMLKVLDVI